MAGVPDLEQAVRALTAAGPALVVKLGERGALCTDGTRRYLAEPPPVKVTDATGAGDCFNAGVIAGLLGGLDLPAAVALGCAVGAASTRAPGGTAGSPDLATARDLARAVTVREVFPAPTTPAAYLTRSVCRRYGNDDTLRCCGEWANPVGAAGGSLPAMIAARAARGARCPGLDVGLASQVSAPGNRCAAGAPAARARLARAARGAGACRLAARGLSGPGRAGVGDDQAGPAGLGDLAGEVPALGAQGV